MNESPELLFGKVFCLKIFPLYQDEVSIDRWPPISSRPLFCRLALSAQLTSEVTRLHELCLQHGLNSASCKIYDICWFFDITQRYHTNLYSTLHVTQGNVYITGSLPGQKSPSFQTSKLAISDIDPQRRNKKIQYSLPVQTEKALSLIQQIEANEVLLNETYDAGITLEPLIEAISHVEQTPVIPYVEMLTNTIDSIHLHGASLQERSEQLKSEIERQSLALLKECLGIEIGDWVYSDNTQNGKGPTKLLLETIDYYQGKLHLHGKQITQKNEVGKRDTGKA